MQSQLLLVIAICLTVGVYCQGHVGGVNGPCSAVALPISSETVSLFGSTVGAVSGATNGCNDDDIDSGVAWYTITPDYNAVVSISTCASYTNFDTIILVYSGGCDSMTCQFIGDDSDTCSYNSGYASLTFTSSGEQYIVGIAGFGGATGNFQLTLSQAVSNTTSTSCANAIVIPAPYNPAVVIYGDTSNSAGFDLSSCNMYSSSKIDWYIINPAPGAFLEISTCNSVTNYDTQLAVLSGSCNSLQCISLSDDNCTQSGSTGYASYISFVPTGISYYVGVFGFSSNSGVYEVRINQNQASQPGISCSSAISIPFTASSTFNFFGTTQGTPITTVSVCNSINSPAAWFQVVVPSGYTRQIRASTCNSATNFDTFLSVFTGSCQALSCINSNDDDGGCQNTLLSTVTWTSSSNGVYYILVSGYNGNVGNFELSVSFQ